jgi:hypothetical protein
MREISSVRPPVEEFKFQDEAEASEALATLIQALKDREVEASEAPTTAQPVQQAAVKTELQGSLLKTVLDSGRPTDLKESFEARSMKSEGEEGGEGSGQLRRIYSLADTAGPLYLKRIQSLAEAKKTQRIVKVRQWERATYRRLISYYSV